MNLLKTYAPKRDTVLFQQMAQIFDDNPFTCIKSKMKFTNSEGWMTYDKAHMYKVDNMLGLSLTHKNWAFEVKG